MPLASTVQPEFSAVPIDTTLLRLRLKMPVALKFQSFVKTMCPVTATSKPLLRISPSLTHTVSNPVLGERYCLRSRSVVRL